MADKIERMKIAANKYIDKLLNHLDNPKAPIWKQKLAELNLEIQRLGIVTAQNMLKSDNPADKAGVEIFVPTKKFGLKELPPTSTKNTE